MYVEIYDSMHDLLYTYGSVEEAGQHHPKLRPTIRSILEKSHRGPMPLVNNYSAMSRIGAVRVLDEAPETPLNEIYHSWARTAPLDAPWRKYGVEALATFNPAWGNEELFRSFTARAPVQSLAVHGGLAINGNSIHNGWEVTARLGNLQVQIFRDCISPWKPTPGLYAFDCSQLETLGFEPRRVHGTRTPEYTLIDRTGKRYFAQDPKNFVAAFGCLIGGKEWLKELAENGSVTSKGLAVYYGYIKADQTGPIVEKILEDSKRVDNVYVALDSETNRVIGYSRTLSDIVMWSQGGVRLDTLKEELDNNKVTRPYNGIKATTALLPVKIGEHMRDLYRAE